MAPPAHALRTSLLAAVLALVALTGCGDDGDDETTDTTATTEADAEPAAEETTEDEATTTTEATGSESEPGSEGGGDEEAVARAASVNLVAGDLPDGWTSEPTSSDEEDDETLNECLGFDFAEATVGRAASPDFSLEGEQGLQNAASLTAVVDDADTATRVVEVVGTQAFGDCFTAAATGDDETATASFSTDPAFPTYGEASSRLTGSISSTDGSFVFAVDIVAVATSDIISLVIVGAAPPPAPTDLLPGLVSAVADRQADA